MCVKRARFVHITKWDKAENIWFFAPLCFHRGCLMQQKASCYIVCCVSSGSYFIWVNSNERLHMKFPFSIFLNSFFSSFFFFLSVRFIKRKKDVSKTSLLVVTIYSLLKLLSFMSLQTLDRIVQYIFVFIVIYISTCYVWYCYNIFFLSNFLYCGVIYGHF